MANFAYTSLRWKSFALIFFLLVCECIFVGSLYFQLHEARQELAQERLLKAVLKKSQRLVVLLNDYEHAMELWVNSKDPDLEKKAASNEIEMTETIKWLQANVKFSEINQHVNGLARLQTELFKMINDVKDHVVQLDRSEAMSYAQGFFSRIRKYRWDWEHSAVNLIREQEDVLKTFPEAHSKRRDIFRKIILLGLIANISVVVFFAFFLWRSVVARLLLVVDNSRRIANRQSLNPALAGSDEISSLDGALHQMNNSLLSAQNERQAFLSMVSHELRTPLATVTLSFEMLSSGIAGEVSSKSLEPINFCESEIKKLLNLVNDLLDLEKLEAGKLNLVLRMVYVETVLEDTVKAFQREIEAKQIEVILPEVSTEVNLDPDRMRQVLAILMQNAIAACPERGKIEFVIKEKKETVEIRVVDNGAGVPPMLHNQLFERFRVLENGELMRGMGLPIAKRIVDLHGGQIIYSPTESQGSCFCLILPLQMAENANPA